MNETLLGQPVFTQHEPVLSQYEPIPTDEEITAWLKSPQVNEWMQKRLSLYYPQWQGAMDGMIETLKKDKNHDWTFRDFHYPRISIGVNAATWTLWVAIMYENGIRLAPDCPFKLKDIREMEPQELLQ